MCHLLAVPAVGQTDIEPILTTIDLNQGEEQEVVLDGGDDVQVRLVQTSATRGSVMGAVRTARVTVSVNGTHVELECGNYNLPVTVEEVRVDCPVTHHYYEDTVQDSWGLNKDARLRVWPTETPLIWPGSFVYPVNQRWFASDTWYSNEPVSKRPDGDVYYHSGIDFGGAEGLVEVYSATDGRVVSVGEAVLEGFEGPPVSERYDVVYIRDHRGWFYRYSHLDWIKPDLEIGQRITAGEQIGRIGKEGHSGGWTHLHFEIKSKQPSGEWGTQDSYAFLWETYRRQYDPDILAVSRPRYEVQVGETVHLDAGRTWSRRAVKEYRWVFGDGSEATGMRVRRTYTEPGDYAPILQVTDVEGAVDYDIAHVEVTDPQAEEDPPGVHATYYPTFDIKPGELVFFKVRASGTQKGVDVWDFGDGSEKVKVKSNINSDDRAPGAYATTTHRFPRPGRYVVEVSRTNEHGTGVDRLEVVVQSTDE